MKKLLFAIVVLIAAGCGPIREPACVTSCGLTYMGNSQEASYHPNFSCDAIQAVEDGLLEGLKAVTDDHRLSDTPEACRRLQRWPVYTNLGLNYWQLYGEDVAGETHCGVPRWILVGGADFNTPRVGALAHEMVHAIQDCNPDAPQAADEDSQHAGWKTRGIMAAIDRARGK